MGSVVFAVVAVERGDAIAGNMLDASGTHHTNQAATVAASALQRLELLPPQYSSYSEDEMPDVCPYKSWVVLAVCVEE